MNGHNLEPVASIDDRVVRLLRLAGRRPSAPNTAEAAVRDAVRRHWHGRIRRRRHVRTLLAVAAAALGRRGSDLHLV